MLVFGKLSFIILQINNHSFLMNIKVEMICIYFWYLLRKIARIIISGLKLIDISIDDPHISPALIFNNRQQLTIS